MRPIFSRSVETRKLLDLFEGASIDTPISFADASRKLGFAITSTSGSYHSARRIAVKECGIVIEAIRNFGFVRLSGSGIVKRGDSHDGALRRRARRAGDEMAIAIVQNLDREEMQSATEKLSRYRIVSDLTSPAKAASNRLVTQEPEQQEPVDIRARLRTVGKS
jgi:hypothetical protein